MRLPNDLARCRLIKPNSLDTRHTLAQYEPTLSCRATRCGRLRAYGSGPGLETRHSKASARLVLEVSAQWVSPSSRGLWGGDALLLSGAAPPALLETVACSVQCVNTPCSVQRPGPVHALRGHHLPARQLHSLRLGLE
jgi:hypothetical protein